MTEIPPSTNSDILRQAGQATDKGGFTKAGRAYQKHGSRNPSRWGNPIGNPVVINEIGQQHLSQIIDALDTHWTTRHHARFGHILEGRLTDGRGARWSLDGRTFYGFLEE